MPLLTFIIPVRHPENATNWDQLTGKLMETVRSIAAQTADDWQGVIVANEGAHIPALPESFRIERVDFSSNLKHDIRGGERDDVLNAFRVDKGRRVLKGMLSARGSSYYMIVDDDDFVSANIVRFVSKHAGHNGWKIDRGLVWSEGGKLVFMENNFNGVCGTSLIIRADLYSLPDRFEDASTDFIASMLGSHMRPAHLLAQRGTPLASLPFRGAVYRVANSGSHSKSPGIGRKYLFNRGLLSRPLRFASNLTRFRFIDAGLKREFFGAGATK